MKFTIELSKWGRNRTADKTFVKENPDYQYIGGLLLDKFGLMCCLGFCTLQLGASKFDILNRVMPAFVTGTERFGPFVFKTVYNDIEDNDFAGEAAEINDDYKTTTRKKIQLLKKLFKENGHELEFVK